MTPEETMRILSETLAECFLDGPPLGALEGADAQEAWLDLTATIVTTLMSRGLYIVESEMYDAVVRYQRTQARRVTYDIPAATDKECPECKGSGRVPGKDERMGFCVRCSGAGRVNP